VPNRFLYQAQAVGLSGQITLPFEELIEVQAASALPQTGGYSSSQADHFSYKQIVSFTSAKTQATGSYSAKDKAYNTLVTATIEKFNVLGQVTADRVVAHLTSKHPESGGQPSIIPLGSYFENLRIAGCPIDVHLDVAAFTELATYDDILQRLQSDRDWHRQLLGEQRPVASPGESLLGSIVRQIHSHCSELKPEGCRIFVPHFGTVYLGEFLIQPYQRSLTMVRIDLGCAVEGHVAACIVSGNGQGY
jgi:hypothetical protein